MPDDEKLGPADPSDLADSIAFALLFSGRKRVHDSDQFMAKIAAERIVQHLEQSRFVLMKKPPIGGAAIIRADAGFSASGVGWLPGVWPTAGHTCAARGGGFGRPFALERHSDLLSRHVFSGGNRKKAS